MARRRMNGSATARISMAVTTRVSTPCCSSASCSARRVDDRRQHAHVVGGGAVHAAHAGRQAAEDVAAADDDGRLDAEALDLADVAGDAGGDGRIDPELLVAHQRFAGELQEDALIERGCGSGIRTFETEL